MALYLVVSPDQVVVDYENGTILKFTTGQVLDAAPGLRSILALTRANPPAIIPYTPTEVTLALSPSGTIDVANLPDANALDAEVTAAVSAHAGAGDPHTGYQLRSEKDAASGYAGLDGSSLLTLSQIPVLDRTKLPAFKSKAFTGNNGTGACTLTGAVAGEKVVAVWSADGSLADVTGDFETTITVNDQIQQSSVSDYSLVKFLVLLS